MVGGALLYVAVYMAAVDNNVPVELPLPPLGIEVSWPFQLTTAGAFDLQARVPDVESKAEGRLVSGAVRVIIEGESGSRYQQDITTFRHGGRFYWGNTDLYWAGLSVPLDRGKYTMRLTTLQEPALFRAHGVILSLERQGRLTERYMQGVLARGVGFACLGMAAVLCFVVATGVARGRFR